jgi:hypothetical protein
MYKVQAGKPAEVSAGYYSRASKPAKYLAPAAIQSEASALILFTKEGTEDSHRSKIRLFLSFRISQLIAVSWSTNLPVYFLGHPPPLCHQPAGWTASRRPYKACSKNI